MSIHTVGSSECRLDSNGILGFIDSLKASFKQGEDCDLTITCGARRWQVHKLILCLHSQVFKKMLRGPFKEGSQAKVALDNDDPDVLDIIFRYMYTFEYSSTPSTLSRMSKLVMSMRVIKAADYYSMPRLGMAARQAFDRSCYMMYYCPRPAVNCDQDVADAISEAFCEDGYDQFRKPLLRIAAENLEVLKAQPEIYKYFWEVVDSCTPFAVALLRYRPEKVSRADQTHTEPRSDKKRKFSEDLYYQTARRQ